MTIRKVITAAGIASILACSDSRPEPRFAVTDNYVVQAVVNPFDNTTFVYELKARDRTKQYAIITGIDKGDGRFDSPEYDGIAAYSSESWCGRGSIAAPEQCPDAMLERMREELYRARRTTR